MQIPQPNANGFQFEDGTGTPVTSPVGSGTSEITLITPVNGSRLRIYADSEDVALRKVSGGETHGICTVPKTTWFEVFTIPGEKIYIGRGSATVVRFMYDLCQ